MQMDDWKKHLHISHFISQEDSGLTFNSWLHSHSCVLSLVAVATALSLTLWLHSETWGDCLYECGMRRCYILISIADRYAHTIRIHSSLVTIFELKFQFREHFCYTRISLRNAKYFNTKKRISAWAVLKRFNMLYNIIPFS